MYEYKIDSTKTLVEAKEFERQFFGARVAVNDSQFSWALASWLQDLKKRLVDDVAFDIGQELGPQGDYTNAASQLCCAHGMGCYQHEVKTAPQRDSSQLELSFTKEHIVFESKKDSCT